MSQKYLPLSQKATTKRAHTQRRKAGATAMSWDDVDNAKSNSDFLSLKAGDKAVVVFLGEPTSQEVFWLDGKTVPAGTAGAKASIRFAIQVATYPGKELKTFENSTPVFKDISRLNSKYGLSNWAFEIARIGSGKETKYSILPEKQLSAADQAAYAALLDTPAAT